MKPVYRIFWIMLIVIASAAVPTGKPYRVGAALFVSEPLREIVFEFDVKEHKEMAYLYMQSYSNSSK